MREAPAKLWVMLAGITTVALLGNGGCATEEEFQFGDPARVAGGTGPSGGGPECIATPICSISWSNDIFKGILDAPVGTASPTGACGEANCHNEGAGGLTLPSGDAATSYFNLMEYSLAGGGQYVVPCHPELSYFICNLRLVDGAQNPFVGPGLEFEGGCGSPMPKSSQEVASTPLTETQLNIIAEWITCGAPLN